MKKISMLLTVKLENTKTFDEAQALIEPWLAEHPFNTANKPFYDRIFVWAAQKGYLQIVQFLHSRGVNVHAKPRGSWPALFRAASAGHIPVVAFLINHGADVNRIYSGETALMHTARFGKIDVIKLLIKHGAQIQVKDSDGYTPLMVAAENGHVEVVTFFREQGLAINERSKYGYTALMLAARKNHLPVVKYLVENGAILDIKNRNDKTARDLAVQTKRPQIVAYFDGDEEYLLRPKRQRRPAMLIDLTELSSPLAPPLSAASVAVKPEHQSDEINEPQQTSIIPAQPEEQVIPAQPEEQIEPTIPMETSRSPVLEAPASPVSDPMPAENSENPLVMFNGILASAVQQAEGQNLTELVNIVKHLRSAIRRAIMQAVAQKKDSLVKKLVQILDTIATPEDREELAQLFKS